MPHKKWFRLRKSQTTKNWLKKGKAKKLKEEWILTFQKKIKKKEAQESKTIYKFGPELQAQWS